MMMELKKLFTPVSSMDADEAKAYMARHREGDYTLLDVRQPGEYEESHLPGAKLMPLPQLSDTYQELDPEKPTIVHCAVGGRSRVAAQMLCGWGFKEVYNLAGGIKAFEGTKPPGPGSSTWTWSRGTKPRRRSSPWPTGWKRPCSSSMRPCSNNPRTGNYKTSSGNWPRWKCATSSASLRSTARWPPAARTWQPLNRPSCRRPWKAALTPRNSWKPIKPTCKPSPRCSIWP